MPYSHVFENIAAFSTKILFVLIVDNYIHYFLDYTYRLSLRETGPYTVCLNGPLDFLLAD